MKRFINNVRNRRRINVINPINSRYSRFRRNRRNYLVNNNYIRWRNTRYRNNFRRLSRNTNSNITSRNNNTNINNTDINYNKKINDLNSKINNLTTDFNKMTLKNTTLSNRFKTNKEMRKDRLISAMNMIKFSSKLGWFKTSLRVIKLDHYMQYSFSPNTDIHLFWCPYAYPLSSNIMIHQNQERAGHADQMSGISYMDANGTLSCMAVDQVKLDGTCRLISATLKIVNVSPATIKSGSYTIYQTTNNFVSPYLYNKEIGPTAPDNIALWYKNLIETSLNTLSTKMVFSASDVGYIEEYNTHEGTNMFNNCKEYLGVEFRSPGICPIAIPTDNQVLEKSNPIGPNINYIIKIPLTQERQNYMIETWAIWEVAPSPESGMSNLASVNNEIFNKNIFDAACNTFPIHK